MKCDLPFRATNMFRVFRRCLCSIGIKKHPPIPVFGLEGRYVSALYSASYQMNQLDEVEKHLRKVLEELSKPKIIDFIDTSLISCGAKAKLLKEVGKQANMPDACTNFLSVVAENGRLKKLRHMIKMFLSVMIAHRNEASCEVITAEPLDEHTRKALMDALHKIVKGKKKIILTEKVDPTVIGGLVVGVEDKVMDLCIARKINMYSEILKRSI